MIAVRMDIQKAFDWMFWTLDPRIRKNPRLEFIPKPYQRVVANVLVDAIANEYDVGQEKSRDMGLTWIDLCVLLWHWLFEKDFQILLLSKNEDAVDNKGDPNSLFERLRWELRMIAESMPGIVPPDWTKFSSEMKLVNPINGSVITGAATTASFSRQGRYNVIMMDEFASIEASLQESIWTATLSATPCRIVLSTPLGISNLYAKMMLALRKDPKAPVSFFRNRSVA